MGLDLVEYVIAIEDAFGIAIPDADAARLTTPQVLVEYLLARLDVSAESAPLVQTAFYRLRRALSSELGVPRATIIPDTSIAELTSRSENEVWQKVATQLGVDATVLTHAPVLQWLAKVRIAPHRSVGAVAKQLAMLRPAALKEANQGWTRAQVIDVVLELLEYETGTTVTPSQLHLTFVRDLGMG